MIVPVSSSATTTLDSGSSTSIRSRQSAAGGSWLLVPKDLLQALHLGGELPLIARTDVGLEDQADPRTKPPNRLAGSPDDVHALIPRALHRGEHRVGVVGKTRVPHDPHCRRDGLTDRARGLIGTGWGDGEGDQHAPEPRP